MLIRALTVIILVVRTEGLHAYSFKNKLLRSGVPVCLVDNENLPYLYFDSRYPFYGFKNTHQQIFLVKFHENSALAGRYRQRVDSISESADSVPLKLNQLLPVRSDFHETLQGETTCEYLKSVEGILYIYRQSKDIAHFHNLQAILKFPTLIYRAKFQE